MSWDELDCYKWAEENLPVEPDDVEESPWCSGCRYRYYGTIEELEKIREKLQGIIDCVLPEDSENDPDSPDNYMDCDACIFEN